MKNAIFVVVAKLTVVALMAQCDKWSPFCTRFNALNASICISYIL